MRSIGICTSKRHVDQLNHEKYRLYVEASNHYDVVRLVDPRAVTYRFIRGRTRPVIMHSGEDISTLDTLIVRSITGREAATAMLARSLRLCGCDVFDPVERFSVGKASKLLTTISRFQGGVGTSTYASFSREGATELLHQLAMEGRFPLVVKPSAGRKGRSIQIVEDVAAAMRHLDQHFGQEEYLDDPFFLQDLVSFEKEYRILVVDGEPLGIVEKVRRPGEVAANAAQGAGFVAADAPHVLEAALPHVSDEGILGVDVGVDPAGDVHIIEANRAPDWEAFERATGLNVARLVIERAVRRR